MNKINRRKVLEWLVGSVIALPLFAWKSRKETSPMFKIAALPQSGPWPTVDPFLFCVHHNDQYPAANEDMGPNASLTGRDIGQDFSNKDGWNMYHGSPIPGFPRHPHRGFETLTVVKRGLIDHSDSLGARARYGDGDAQWLTAGDGIVHAEMFPLLNRDSGNPMDFFQIWINLPASKKRVDPHFTMFWDMQIPRIEVQDENANTSKIKIVAGTYMDHEALQPPPNSWAAEPDSDLAVWVIQMDAQAEWKLPAAAATSLRSLYVVKGKGVSIDEQTIPVKHRIEFTTTDEVLIRNLGEETELLLLQGKPIREPVVQYGPFVMNTRQEIQDAFDDYSKTEFGGWRWTDGGPVHGRNSKKFAQLIDGTLDEPE